MQLYHELPDDALRNVIENGLRTTDRGDKGDDESIKRTDQFLDERRPDHLRQAGVSRQNNLYAYIGDATTIVCIEDGRQVPLDEHIRDHPDSALLRLNIALANSYVSDLMRFDAVKDALEKGRTEESEQLAQTYWMHVRPLTQYTARLYERPEAMIIHDVPPDAIEPVTL